MSSSFIEDISYLYNHIETQQQNILNEESEYFDENFSNLVENVFWSICTSMLSEGYSSNGVFNFLASASVNDIIEKYKFSVISEELVSEEYIGEQLEFIYNVISEGWRDRLFTGAAEVIGRGSLGRQLAKAEDPVARLAAIQRLTNTTGKTGAETAAELGKLKAAKIAEPVTAAASKVKELGQKALPMVKKAGSLAATAGVAGVGGYVGAKMAGAGSNTPTASTPKVAVPKSPTTPSASGSGGSGSGGSGSGGSGPVLSKQGGVEGTGVGKNFKAGAWSDTDKARYTAQAAKTIQKSPQGYPIGTTPGGTKYEIRTPTSKEMAASKAAGGGEAGVRAATALNQPTQGPSNATIDPKAVQADLQRANAMASNPASGKTPNRPADAPKTPTELTSTPGAGRDDLMKRQAAAAKNEAYDAYDLVLEYLFDNGHVDTVEEAHYIMMEMDPETVGNICEAKKPKKWIQGTHMKKGALHKQLGIPEDEKIPAEMLTKAAKEPGKLGRRARFAQTLKGLHKEEE